ncbi:MAG TPA: hypothetical protein PK926_05640 [Spirochaetota bacterium]|mgnify:CR=1 FL=1|nr:hypothetical protein [Spirochaetota bacterium]HPI87754.1 hypothetical protein [Spirochaetota bacterium]HPR48121.1 hypothetical protein [Spirochaetota bacterium]
MKKVIIFFCTVLVYSCSTQKQAVTDNAPREQETSQYQENVHEGWAGDDTYTVHVTAEDMDAAVSMARHQILKDIVNVRMRNNSRYTDITKIQDEFKKPLENGKILNPGTRPDGVEIWFQIYDVGLREKFERK